VGQIDAAAKHLIKTTYEALELAIAAVKPGALCRDFGDIISKHVHKQGFSVVRSYTGHGVGYLFHGLFPNIPHYAKNKAVGVLKPGMIFTIEPMINEGSWKDITWPDDWTSVTTDGKRSAQFEHTLLVTEKGVEVLTARTKHSPRFFWETEDNNTDAVTEKKE
jgi:methionyl aminopeptidase